MEKEQAHAHQLGHSGDGAGKKDYDNYHNKDHDKKNYDKNSVKPPAHISANTPAKNSIGITVTKEADFSEWYQQLILKADLADYTQVSGCIVFKPASYTIWEKIQQFIDERIKKLGVRNAYFPLLIPENLLTKEKEHVAGFSPEVAWVTQAGSSTLPERLAIRPTSETIMYDSYSKWIRSHKDLPLLINQWCNVVRWEFKNPVPFLRTREFLWQEGHTVHATKEGAEKEVKHILLEVYKKAYEDLLAVPVLAGQKSENEKFAGAVYTLSLEALFPNGKVAQACTSHFLGQNFARSFGITFTDEKGEKQHAYQNSWGFTTRSIGIMIGIHSDDRGLVLPPKVAEHQVAIVPIIFDDTKEKVLASAREIKEDLEDDFRTLLDDRDDCSPGWKFSEHELKGVCLRIELGPKDLEKDQVVAVARDTRVKQFVPRARLHEFVREELERMHARMFAKAATSLKGSIVECADYDSLKKALAGRKLGFAQWCGAPECEEGIKAETGAKSINIPFEEHRFSGAKKCVRCNSLASVKAYFGKSY